VQQTTNHHNTSSGVCGRLISWTVRSGEELLQEPNDLCCYRVPTDNDLGGDLFSYATQWKACGLASLSSVTDRLQTKCTMCFALPTTFSTASWLGLGPHESYLHRQASAYLDASHSLWSNYIPNISVHKNDVI